MDSEIETFEDAFMAHIVMPDGQTVAERAAAICDALKAEILAGNEKSRGKGPTKMGLSLAMIAETAGDRISEFRDKFIPR